MTALGEKWPSGILNSVVRPKANRTFFDSSSAVTTCCHGIIKSLSSLSLLFFFIAVGPYSLSPCAHNLSPALKITTCCTSLSRLRCQQTCGGRERERRDRTSDWLVTDMRYEIWKIWIWSLTVCIRGTQLPCFLSHFTWKLLLLTLCFLFFNYLLFWYM